MRGFRRTAGVLGRSLILLFTLVAGIACAACATGSAAATVPPRHATPTASPSQMPSPIPSPSPSPTATPAGQTEPVPILMYHYVRPNPGGRDPIGHDLSVTPENFADQMSFLASHEFNTLTLEELADVRARRLALPPNPIVLTFDDGYRDFYTNVWPALRQHHIKATSFIITGVVDQPHYVTWAMIDEMQRSGLVEFGAHTVTHHELPSLSDAEAKQEIDQSKQTLEAHLGHPVRSFAYPVGRYNARDLALLREAGIDIAVTTKGGFAKPEQDSLQLPRVRIHGGTTLSQFEAILQ